MKAIVTVKLPKHWKHNPQHKIKGQCPIPLLKQRCTDVTGEHHSYLETGISEAEIKAKAEAKFVHITRIEFFEEET